MLLLFSTSCRKTEVSVDGLRMVNGVPYYYFTEADQPWLQIRQGDVWQFRNAQGSERTYTVYQRWSVIQQENREIIPPGSFINNTPKLLNYNDHILLRIRRTDSLGQGGGEFQFHRDAARNPSQPLEPANKNRSQFYVNGQWTEFVGDTDLNDSTYPCRGLKFPAQPALNAPFQQLTVQGKLYTEVLLFRGNRQNSDCSNAPTPSIEALYYDRQAGIVRMVSKTGQVWDRIP